MADVKSKIMSKYGIDIADENVFKLYKLDSADITPEELETKIQETRKRWNSSINGANEKNAQRDKLRLEKADKYEAILKDDKLRKEVFKYYDKSNGGNNGANAGSEATEFAKEYFELVATTKKIKKSDVEFFFKYYQSERKNKKAILEMLSKEFKVKALGKEDKYANEDDADEEGKKKDEKSPLIVNLFQEATVLKIRRAIEKFEEAKSSEEVCKRYPEMYNGLYAFLGIQDVEDADGFVEYITARGKEVYAVRQEKGTEYVPLVDMFNILQSIGKYNDVVDNIPEFKLLLKYPNLTSYMFAFVDMKPNTVKGMIDVANKDYVFRDDADFLLNYYEPVHDNFGISDSSIGSIMRKAKKNAKKNVKKNKVVNNIDKKRKISIGANILHWLLYWPIFAIYFVFEVVKGVFTRLHKYVIPTFVCLFLFENWLLPQFNIENLLTLKKLLHKKEWLAYLNDFMHRSGENTFDTILLSLLVILILLLVYILPPLFVSMFIACFADDFNKKFDWTGIERTFKKILGLLRTKTETAYYTQRETFFKSNIKKIAVNFVCLIVLIIILCTLVPKGLKIVGDATGSMVNAIKEEYFSDDEDEENIDETTNSQEDVDNSLKGKNVVIIQKSANIRSGASTDFELIRKAKKGDTFIATGKTQVATNGRTWYEIYLDDTKEITGWINQSNVEIK